MKNKIAVYVSSNNVLTTAGHEISEKFVKGSIVKTREPTTLIGYIEAVPNLKLPSSKEQVDE